MTGRPAGRALVFRQFGDPASVLALEPQAMPVAGGVDADAVVVRMSCRPVNPSDLIPITGAYAHRVVPPRIAGYEGVGLVEQAHSGCGLAVGDRVLPLRGGGTWASFVVAPARYCVPVPASIDDEAAAQAYINPLTAWALLVDDLALPRGAVIAIDAAGSAFTAVVLALAADHGWSVVAVTTAPQRAAGLLAAGAAAVVAVAPDDTAPGLAAHIRRAAGAAIDAGLDAVGGMIGRAVALSVSPGGAFRVYGLLSGQPLPAALAGEVAGGVTVRPFWLRHWQDRATVDRWSEGFAWIFDALARRRLTLPVAEAFGLDDWQAALVAAARRDRQGKVLLSGG
ncbi:alcohol dehydrogenase [Tistrella bauzanensis]|uniref:Alcohol dehydrogenase n=1 Tax=Tistrella bauzanensis TaxID=657419 RepID=A0ABQ1IK49_9PROT|nr:zinc-dependent alcohol dehydrogenase family protein [Tistrella bauzanensis]GGB43325.1 alcohol dehydrogenase [Tistrella bauzanensis]